MAEPTRSGALAVPRAGRVRSLWQGAAKLLREGLALLSISRDRAPARRRLRKPDARFLSDRVLKDMGLSRGDVERNSTSTFWRP